MFVSWYRVVSKLNVFCNVQAPHVNPVIVLSTDGNRLADAYVWIDTRPAIL